MTDRDEIIRLRDRLHALDGTVAGLVHSHQSLSTGLGGLRDDVRRLSDAVNELSNADKIAAAVTAAVRSDRKHVFSVWQKIAGALVTAVVVAPSAHQIVGWIGL